MKTKASYNLKLREYFINISSSQLLDFMNLKHFQQVILSSYLIKWLFFRGNSDLPTDPNNELVEADKMGDEEGNPHPDYDHLTPAERRYIKVQKSAKR